MENKCYIYTISLENKVMYVGQTNNFNKRKDEHLYTRSKSAIPNDVDKHQCIFNVVCECNNKTLVLEKEDELIMQYDTINCGWNKQRSGLITKDKDSYKILRCDIERERKRKYREANKEKISEQRKHYRETHRKQILESKKRYRETHADKIREYRKKI